MVLFTVSKKILQRYSKMQNNCLAFRCKWCAFEWLLQKGVLQKSQVKEKHTLHLLANCSLLLLVRSETNFRKYFFMLRSKLCSNGTKLIRFKTCFSFSNNKAGIKLIEMNLNISSTTQKRPIKRQKCKIAQAEKRGY